MDSSLNAAEQKNRKSPKGGFFLKRERKAPSFKVLQKGNKMRRYFVKTNGYNCVIFADGSGKGYMFHEIEYDVPLTLEVAKNDDYSGIEDIETVEGLAANFGSDKNVINFDPDDFYSNPECEITEF